MQTQGAKKAGAPTARSRHIHRLAGGRHPINHEKLAPLSAGISEQSLLLLLASSLKSMSRLLDRWATQGWAYLFLAWPAIIIEKIQIRAKASYAYQKYYYDYKVPQGSIHQNDALKPRAEAELEKQKNCAQRVKVAMPNTIFRSQKYVRQGFNQRLEIFCFTCENSHDFFFFNLAK